MNKGIDLATPAAWWRWAKRWRQHQLVDTCNRVAVLEHVDEAGKLAPRYAFMIVLSCGIATLGLLQNSAAVIIGCPRTGRGSAAGRPAPAASAARHS